jgi:hypothetical protein
MGPSETRRGIEVESMDDEKLRTTECDKERVNSRGLAPSKNGRREWEKRSEQSAASLHLSENGGKVDESRMCVSGMRDVAAEHV